jgi:hypothetical protein
MNRETNPLKLQLTLAEQKMLAAVESEELMREQLDEARRYAAGLRERLEAIENSMEYKVEMNLVAIKQLVEWLRQRGATWIKIDDKLSVQFEPQCEQYMCARCRERKDAEKRLDNR